MRIPLLTSLVLTVMACAPPTPTWTATDADALRALEDAFRTAWLADDTTGVLATMTPDAVLMPPGFEPLVGDAAIRTYWWPTDGSRTLITGYTTTFDEVAGSGDVGWVRGRGEIAFTYVTPAGDSSQSISRAIFLSVARRGADGAWRITHRSWSSPR